MRRLTVTGLVIVLLIAGGTGIAQEPQAQPAYATVTALEQIVIPPSDRVDLARRLRGVTTIPDPPLTPDPYEVGDQAVFWASNLTADESFRVSATLRLIGQHIVLWVEDGASVDMAELQALADGFDSRVYDSTRALWGEENSPGIDGDPRIHGLFLHRMGQGTLAYFASQHTFPREIVSTSNEHEMFMLNLDAAGNNLSALESIMAHEFQHMIRDQIDANEDSWLNEGFSMFTELYLGYENPVTFMNNFMQDPNTQVNAWTGEGARVRDYGAALAFVAYFYDRYGQEGIQALSVDPLNGLTSVDHVLHEMNAPDVNTFFADWVVANYVNDLEIEDGRYGYRLLTSFNRPAPFAMATTYPYVSVGSVNQYATNYHILTDLQGKTSLNVAISVPQEVQLLPITPLNGEWIWYSNRGDESDTTLTRAFDLSEVGSATLYYNAWYHLENLWDYAYLMVSTDDGATWTPLASTSTTTDDPNFNAYGPGYTGESGGWVAERVTLDDYAGQEILLRFEVITDTAVTQPGLVIDDVAIPEIGYTSDFEVDGGGWEAAGWLRTDNRLPQDAWIQAIQKTAAGTTTITRWQASTGYQWELPLVEGVEQVVIAVSPFAPATLVPMPYTLNIAAY